MNDRVTESELKEDNGQVIFTHAMVHSMVGAMCSRIDKDFKAKMLGQHHPTLRVFPIPRGGIPIAYALAEFRSIKIVDDPANADIFVDDIYDSGVTCERWCKDYPGIPFYVAVDKSQTVSPNPLRNKWIVFPWERSGDDDNSATDNITRLLQYIGEDPTREGLQETPKRVLKAWEFHTSGYDVDIPALLKVFEDGAENYDQMIIVKDIPIYSSCEHHLEAIFGTVSIGYIPNGKIVGLSKLSRVADAFARRLQVQERLTSQIADCLVEHLQPLGVGVVIKARHMCMERRGVCKQGHHTITSALRGVMKTETDTRAEFMNLVKD